MLNPKDLADFKAALWSVQLSPVTLEAWLKIARQQEQHGAAFGDVIAERLNAVQAQNVSQS